MTDTATPYRYDPLAPDVQADPYPYYAMLRREAPVYHLADLDLWAVSRFDDVRRVMRDNASFSSEAMAEAVSRPDEFAEHAGLAEEDHGPTVSIIGTDGEPHARLRQIVNRGFTPRRIAALEPEIRAMARRYVKDFVDAGGGELQAAVAVPFPIDVIAALLGVDAVRRDDFRRWAEHMVIAVFERPDDEQQLAILQSGTDMMEWLEDVIAMRDGSDADDLVSVLLRAERGVDGDGSGALTHDELRVFAVTLLVAGSITTAYLIGNAVLALLDRPHVLAAVRDDLALVPPLVEEALRFDAPTQLMLRTATADIEIAGTTIPRGATVAPLQGSANRDENAFPLPDVFDPHRRPTEHLTFGHGAHYCLGAALARMEARVALEELLSRVRGLEPTGRAERVESLVFRGPRTLPLRIT
jgi:cytochrome P450